MNRKLIFTAVALAVQIAAIGWLIVRYERVVTKGMEVRFACQAYDPYDPLRGRYLHTTVQETCTNLAFTVTKENRFNFGKSLYAKIEPKGGSGIWQVVCVAEKPQGEGVWIKAKTRFDHLLGWDRIMPDEGNGEFLERREASGYKAIVSMPNQLFVSEKLAPAAEKVLSERTSSAVAVYRVQGEEIVIVDIEIDGRSILGLAREQAAASD